MRSTGNEAKNIFLIDKIRKKYLGQYYSYNFVTVYGL